MSDFTPEYVKMCETCGLPWTPEVGMMVMQPKVYSLIIWLIIDIVPDSNTVVVNALESNGDHNIAIYKETCVPLWSQEQLQGMVKHKYKNIMDLWRAFSEYYVAISYRGTNPDTPLRQIWIRFVQRKLHNKKWTGEDWEAIE